MLHTMHPRPAGVDAPGLQAGPAYEGVGQSIALSGRTALVGAIGVNNVAGAVYVYVRAGKRWGLQAILTDPRNTPYDFFGWSTALAGNTALIGSTGPHHFSGIAYVYDRIGTHWRLVATLTDPLGVSYDSFGYSVALDGATAVLGTNGGSGFPGAAYVYVRAAGRWELQASLTDPGDVMGDDFGLSVAMSGSTAVIGAPGAHDQAGAAYVYRRSGTHWQLQTSLADPAGTSSDAFGSVAISGPIILIGAPGTAAGKKAGTGAAYVYASSGTGWALRATLTGPAGEHGEFGNAVALLGVTAAVGADASKSGSGAAFVYVLADHRWRRQASPASPGGGFGTAVAVAGTTAVIGAPGVNLAAGAAFVYARSGATWRGQGQLIDPRGVFGNEKGAAVAISGTTAVIGAWGVQHTSGAAYIYVKSGSRWHHQATLYDPGRHSFDWFGAAVAVSGSTVVIGAWGGAKLVAGRAYVYVRSRGRWRLQATITGLSHYDDLGASLALSGTTLVIGAPGESDSDGAVYVYVRSGTHWHQQAVLPGPHAAFQGFGEAVALSGDTIAIGASGANYYTGAAYVYARAGQHWTLRASLTDLANRPNDGFGTAVAISGIHLVVGAPGVDDYAGAVYFYQKSQSRWRLQSAGHIARKDDLAGGFGGALATTKIGRTPVVVIGGASVSGLALTESQCGSAFEFGRSAGSWDKLATIADPKCSSYDEYGYAVAVSGHTALIGAPGAHDNAGNAFVHVLPAS